MNASSKSLPNGPSDTEITAELPVLDVAAYEANQGIDPLSSTDTWATSSLNTAILPQLTNPVAEAAPEPASISGRLETELKSLANNLAELKARLAAKGERLLVIEAELADSRAAGLAAATRAGALTDELAGSQAATAAANAQLETLRSSLAERETAVKLAAERETGLQQSLERREAAIETAQAADAARTAALLATHENALRTAQQHTAQLQAQSIAQLEALQSLEGRRGIFDSILRTLDLDLSGRDLQKTHLGEELTRSTTHGLELTRALDARIQQVTQLEAEIAEMNKRLGARTDEAGVIARTNEELSRKLEVLQTENEGKTARIAALEAHIVSTEETHTQALRNAESSHGDLKAGHSALAEQKAAQEAELTTLRQQIDERATALSQLTAEHASRLALLEARDATIASLTAQVDAHAKTLATETERARTTQERIDSSEAELRTQREGVERVESELRSRDMRIEELTRINSKMQGDIAEARVWLNERDSLLNRLESEAAHSAALVDTIQRSIRTGNTGSHELVREAGTRLLVRSQDGHEVVHVLSRKTTIGRTPDNDLQIDASFVSRHHAVLLISGSQTIIEDLNSTNGIHVNGKRITRESLKDGDQVMVGRARFRFVVRPAPTRATAEASV